MIIKEFLKNSKVMKIWNLIQTTYFVPISNSSYHLYKPSSFFKELSYVP